jgi:hypothetical protein
VKEKGKESVKEGNEERENNKKLFVVQIMNILFCLFTIHIIMKNYILPTLLETKNNS